MQQHCPLRVFFGFDDKEEIKRMRDAGEPFVFMDHAYFHRGYRHDAFYRAIFNALHRTNLLDVPDDRLKKTGRTRGITSYSSPRRRTSNGYAAIGTRRHWSALRR